MPMNEGAVDAAAPVPRDEVGKETLERLGDARAFNEWMFRRLEPWLGASVVEIGAGLGNLSQFIVDRERVLLTDMDEGYLAHLRERFAGLPAVGIGRLELPDVDLSPHPGEFDSAICLNVLEHIEQDVAALEAMARMLNHGGRLIILVPAFGWLYGTLDEALGHCRRYTKPMLRERFTAAGLDVVHMEYFNMAAMPGWWLAGRVFKRRLIPTASLAVYRALVPLFRLERLLPLRVGQSLIAVGRKRS